MLHLLVYGNMAKYKGRFLVFTLSILILSLFYSIYWLIIARYLENNFDDLLKNHLPVRVSGSFEGIQVRGYPFKFLIMLRNPRLNLFSSKTSETPVEWQWDGKTVFLSIRPWRLYKPTINLPKNTEFRIQKNKNSIILGVVDRLSIEFQTPREGEPNFFQIEANKLHLKHEHKNKKLYFEKLNSKLIQTSQFSKAGKKYSVVLELFIRHLSFPESVILPFGPVVRKIDVRLTSSSNLSQFSSIDALRNWRNSGGVVELASAEFEYGPLKSRLVGTIALDQDLQMLAAISSENEGVYETIEQLVKKKILKTSVARGLKILIPIISKKSFLDSADSISLPLSIQNRQFKILNLIISSVPRINWEGSQ